MDSPILSILPTSFAVAAAVLLALTVEAVVKRTFLSSLLDLAVYFTIGLWYFADIFIDPDTYRTLDPSSLSAAYWQVVLFLLAYRFIPRFFLAPSKLQVDDAIKQTNRVKIEAVLALVVPVWLGLMVIGFWRMDWNIVYALLPVGGRNAPHMWSRGAVGGRTDFLVSTGSYIYNFICALFGVLLVLARKKPADCILLLLLMAISWPAYFLLGIRHQLLAVVVPMILTFLILSRWALWKRALVALAALICLHFTMLAMLQMRNQGWDAFWESPFKTEAGEVRHEGLNMGEELAFINGFYGNGELHLTYGADYVAHFANAVPRMLWKSKPKVGFEYAVLRGQPLDENGQPAATISTGLIGQGVVNFGPWLGPLTAACLMCLYTGFLVRQCRPGEHPARLFLFLVGVGLLPNLGRDFTPLVFWPLIFGDLVVRYIDWRSTHAERFLRAPKGGKRRGKTADRRQKSGVRRGASPQKDGKDAFHSVPF